MHVCAKYNELREYGYLICLFCLQYRKWTLHVPLTCVHFAVNSVLVLVAGQITIKRANDLRQQLAVNVPEQTAAVLPQLRSPEANQLVYFSLYALDTWPKLYTLFAFILN